jgi:hypothetical protein
VLGVIADPSPNTFQIVLIVAAVLFVLAGTGALGRRIEVALTLGLTALGLTALAVALIFLV